ncbi:MAG: diguanylate cyclase, partial [Rhodococcus erythropolis]
WHLLFSGAVIVIASIGVFTDVPSGLSDVLGRIAFAIPVITVIPVVTQIALALLSNDAQSSELDPLTDLLNRRGLSRRTSELLQAKSSLDQSLLVVVIDIDNFKHFNDTYGHDVGDRVILRTAYRLHDWARSDAAIARIGGDEFVVVQIMPLPYVGDLLARIAPIMNSPTGEPLSTTSIGIAIHNGGWPDVQAAESGVHDLHRLADSAMYESKRMGGNHVHSIVLTDQQPQQSGGRSVV